MPSVNGQDIVLPTGSEGQAGPEVGRGEYFAPIGDFGALCGPPSINTYFAVALAPDPDPPELINFVPPLNTKIARTQPVQFDMTDKQANIVAVVIRCALRGEKVTEVVYEYDDFVTPYLGSTKEVLANGDWRFVIRRSGGWIGAPQFRAFVVDRSGNINA